MFDIILSGGKIVDGSGKPAFRSDLGIRGEKIACIGDLNDISSKTRIDVDNAIVAPGFIDMHTHSDFILLVDGGHIVPKNNPTQQTRIYSSSLR